MSLFNLGPVLRQLSTATITVRRPSAPGYDANGMAVPPTFTTFVNVRTSFQNLPGTELQHMPEGDRDKVWVKIWPSMQVETGDRIVHPTRGAFIVQMLDNCVADGGFTGAFARKLGDGEA